MKIVYLVSGQFDYYAATNPDAGPQYAEDIGLRWEPFCGSLDGPDTVYIVDQRLTADELSTIKDIGDSDESIRLIFRLVDPYYSFSDDNGFITIAFSWAARERTAILSAYQDKELASYLLAAYGHNRFHVSPYPYAAIKEVHNKQWHDRIKKVIISGSNAKGLYPLRTFARYKRNTSLRWRLMTVDQRHPGYMAAKSLALTGDRYLEYLSGFKLMLICPGRSNLEFMKFRECAYAGCVPVGMPADGLPQDAADCIIPMNWERFPEKLARLRGYSDLELEEMAFRYRNAMRMHRNPSMMLCKLASWIDQVFSDQR